MTGAWDNGGSGRGACILSCAQKPSISSGPGNLTCSAVSVIPYPSVTTRPPSAVTCDLSVLTPKPLARDRGTFSQCLELRPHHRRVHFGCVTGTRGESTIGA